MMITKSDNSPVSSFDSTLQAVLRAGMTKEVRIKFDTRRFATRFQHRLNALRLAMRKANHPDWEQLYRAGIHRDKNDDTVVVVAPRDSEFEPFIKAAGINGTFTPRQVVEYTVDPTAPAERAEEFLASLREDILKKD